MTGDWWVTQRFEAGTEPQPRRNLDLLSEMLDGRTMQLPTIPWAEFPDAASPMADRAAGAPAAGGPAAGPPAEHLAPAQMIRIVAGRGVAALGDQFLLFAIPLLVLKLTGSASLTGLTFLIEWLPRVLYMPIAGVLADRVGGYRLYLIADVVRAALAFGAFFLIMTWTSGQFVTLSLLAAGASLAGAQAYVALETTLPRFVPDSQLVRAQATMQGTEQGSAVLGPALAAVLAVVLDTDDLLLIVGGLFTLTALNTLSLRRKLRHAHSQGDRPTVRSVVTGVGQGAGLLRRMPAVVGLVGLTMTVNLMIGIGMATAAAITTQTFGKPDGWFGGLSTTAAVLSLLTLFFAPKLSRRVGSFPAILGCVSVICLGGLAVSQAGSFVSFAIGYAVLIGTVSLLNVFTRAERVRRIPREHVGKVIGVMFLLAQIPVPIAGGLVALFADWSGPQSVVLGAVLAAMVFVVCLLPLLSKLRIPPPDPSQQAAG